MSAGHPTTVVIHDVAPRITQVVVPMPRLRNPIAHFYIVLDDDGSPHLIDAGLDDAESRAALNTGLAHTGHDIEDVRSVTVTHAHHDHTGLAAFVRARSDAEVAVHRADADAMRGTLERPREPVEAWGVPEPERTNLATMRLPTAPGVPEDRTLDDGDDLRISGADLTTVHTPGHSAGSACFVSRRLGVIFTGDHVLPNVFPGVGLTGLFDDNPFDLYRRSLRRITQYDGLLVLPGHGWVFTGLAARVQRTLANHRRRAEEVAKVSRAESHQTVWDVASNLTWGPGWQHLRNGHLLSALRQTAWHLAATDPGNDADTRWRL